MASERHIRKIKSRRDAAQRIKWMLTRKSATDVSQPGRPEKWVPSYGDLTSLNTYRLILDSVGISLLSDIVNDFMDLLDTSCAVYEKNGDYALGIFSSSWCRFMDKASRRQCDTPDNRTAIKSGKWHCHESYWNEAALRSIETNEPMDVACRGGIRLFAVPIFAGKDTVGSISVGYGDPPRNPSKLRELAMLYGVSVKDLRQQSETYETRPPFIIELAKKRILSSACFIKEIVERRRAERALRESEEKYRSLVEGLNEALFRMTLPDGIYEYVSPGVKHTLGYNAEEILANPLLVKKVIHTDFHGYFKEKFENLIKGVVPPTFEYKIVDSERKERWIIQSNKGIFDDQGKIIAIEGLCRDISEHKRAEESLEKRIVALTQPLNDVESVAFEDLFNLPDLQHLQDLFAEVWGVAALITRPDGTPITQPSNFTYFCSEFIRKTETGSKNCQISDAALGRHNPSGPIIQTCLSAGLCGAGASITVGGRHIANWLIGQVRNEAQSEEQMMEYAREIGADENAFREAFLKVPTMPQEKFDQIAHALFALANQLSATAYQNIQQARFIAERKQAEEALRESEERFRRVVESSPLAIGFADRDGRVEYVNPKFIEKLGYTLDDIPTMADWFKRAFPDPVYRQSTIEYWQKTWKTPATASKWR